MNTLPCTTLLLHILTCLHWYHVNFCIYCWLPTILVKTIIDTITVRVSSTVSHFMVIIIWHVQSPIQCCHKLVTSDRWDYKIGQYFITIYTFDRTFSRLTGCLNSLFIVLLIFFSCFIHCFICFISSVSTNMTCYMKVDTS